ncbi:MAG: 6-phosphofructokinase [Christensenellales bacterium]|jgi:6-phosphofructokinase 1
MKRIGILTSGGDAPGMNACIRALVRYASYYDIEVYGIERGYVGLITNQMKILTKRSVSDIIQRGGTILKTARCPEFNEYKGIKEGACNLSLRNIEGLVVIGGDGSFRGAKDLYEKFGVKVVGIPGTIDNDLNYTDFTLGFDTAVNTVLSAINNLRDTMDSHDRVSIVEVMGRHCGDIALYAGIAGGAEIVLVPERKVDIDEVADKLLKSIAAGKQSGIIVLAEGAYKLEDLKSRIEEKTKLIIRTTVLGHIQRGGTPTMTDRVLAAKFAVRAVELLKADKGGRLVGIKGNKIIDEDIVTALDIKSNFDHEMLELIQILSL